MIKCLPICNFVTSRLSFAVVEELFDKNELFK